MMPPYKKYYTECPALNTRCETTKRKPQTRQQVKCPSTVQYECECPTDDSQDSTAKNANGGAYARRYIMVEQVDDSDEQASEAACLAFSEQDRLCKAEAEVRRLKKILRQHQSQHQQEITVMNECNCAPKPKPRRSQCCTCDCETGCYKNWRPRCQGKPVVICTCSRRYASTPAPEMWYSAAQPYYDKYSYPQDMYIPQAPLPQDPYYAPSYSQSRRYYPADMAREPSIIQQPIPQPSFVQQQPSFVQQQPSFVQQQPSFVQPQASFTQPQASFIQPSVIAQGSFMPTPVAAPQPSFIGQPSYVREGAYVSASAMRQPSFAPQQSYVSGQPPFRQTPLSTSTMQTFGRPTAMMPDPTYTRQQPSTMQAYTPSSTMPQQMYSRVSMGPTPSNVLTVPVPSFSRASSYIDSPYRPPSFISEPQMPAEMPIIDEGSFIRAPSTSMMQQQPSSIMPAPSFIQPQQVSQPFINSNDQMPPAPQRSHIQPSQVSFRQPSSISQARHASAVSQRSMNKSQMSNQQMQGVSSNAFPNQSFHDENAEIEDYALPTNDTRISASGIVSQDLSHQLDPDMPQQTFEVVSQRSNYSAQRPMSSMSVGSRRASKRSSYIAQLPQAPGESEDYYQTSMQPSTQANMEPLNY